MRYTKWIEDNLTNQGSSAETHDLIKKAKKSSLVWILGVRVFLLAAAFVLVDLLGRPFGIARFEGLSGWVSVGAGFALAEFVAGKFEHVIIISRIRKLAGTE